jgi:hypothetical protein
MGVKLGPAHQPKRHRLRVLEDKVLRRIFGRKGENNRRLEKLS